MAPFAINGYDDAVAWSDDIQRTLNDGTMPPWKPVAGYGQFRDSFALTADEKQTHPKLDLERHGSRRSRRSAGSVAVAGAWPLGSPDMVLQPAVAYTPPRGKDVYRCFVLPETNFTENTCFEPIDIGRATARLSTMFWSTWTPPERPHNSRGRTATRVQLLWRPGHPGRLHEHL